MIIVPTRRFVVLAFVATMVATIAGLVPGIDPAWVALDGLIVAMAAFDAFAARGRRVEVERKAAQIFSVGRGNPVTLSLHNTSPRVLRGTVSHRATLGAMLRDTLSPGGVQRMVEASRPVYDLARLSVGHPFGVTFGPDGLLAAFTYGIDELRTLRVTRRGEAYQAEVVQRLGAGGGFLHMMVDINHASVRHFPIKLLFAGKS